MTDVKTDEIRATIGFINRTVTCRVTEAGLEIQGVGDTARISYHAFSEARYHRRGSGRAVLGLTNLIPANWTV